MSCGTRIAARTTRATMSARAHERRYDRARRIPGTHRSSTGTVCQLHRGGRSILQAGLPGALLTPLVFVLTDHIALALRVDEADLARQRERDDHRDERARQQLEAGHLGDDDRRAERRLRDAGVRGGHE